MNKVSVITVSLNNDLGLELTVQSVLAQNYPFLQYIVIDGGSTDRSKEILEQHSNSIDYWVSEPDNGIYHAMNKGLKKADGEYIHFLNAGDTYIHQGVLQNIFVENHTESFIRCKQICDYGERKEIWDNLGNRRVTLYDMITNTMLHQATLIHSNMFNKYGYYDESLKITSDWKFFLQAILGGEETLFVDIPLVNFKMDGISTKGGALGYVLKDERSRVIHQTVPPNLLPDYQKLYTYEKYDYLLVFFETHKFIYRIFHSFYKILNTFLPDSKKVK